MIDGCTKTRRLRSVDDLAVAIFDGIEVLNEMIKKGPEISRVIKQNPIKGLLNAFLGMAPESRQIAYPLLNAFNEAILTFLGGVEVLNRQDPERTERRFLDFFERERHRRNSRQSNVANEGSSSMASASSSASAPDQQGSSSTLTTLPAPATNRSNIIFSIISSLTGLYVQV